MIFKNLQRGIVALNKGHPQDLSRRKYTTTYCPPGPHSAMTRKFLITQNSLAGDAENHQKKSDNELKILLQRSEQ